MTHLKTAFQDKKVLILGDVMVDRYLYGQVNRISPEAPVPVVDFQRTEDRLGGAANVALNIKVLGGQPVLVSIVGADEDGEVLKKLLSNQKITYQGIHAISDRPTTVKTRVMAANQHLLRIDREEKHDISTKIQTQLLDRIKAILKKQEIAILLFQDYNKGVLTKDLIHQTIELATQYNIPTVVDPKFHQFLSYQKVSLFKPNLKEVQQIVPFPVLINLESLTRATNYLEEQLGQDATMITLSADGIFIKNKRHAEIFPTAPRIIADVCGAGDAVVAVAALGMAAGLSLPIIAKIANIAGGRVCEQVGVVPVELETLMEDSQ